MNIDPRRLYAWQKDAQPPLPADPAEAAEVRALCTANKRLAQELDILKKPSLPNAISAGSRIPQRNEHAAIH